LKKSIIPFSQRTNTPKKKNNKYIGGARLSMVMFISK
jgi:hypothetical protein